MLLVAIIVDPTAWVYSFEAPADRKEAVGTPTPATNSMPRQRLRSISNMKSQTSVALGLKSLQSRTAAAQKNRIRLRDLTVLHGQ